MRLAILNLTGGGASGGYLRYLEAMLPRLAASPKVAAVLCAAPPALGFEALFSGVPKVEFSACEPFRFMRHHPASLLRSALDAFRPDVIFVPLERYVRYKDVKVVCVLHNMAPLAGAKTGEGMFSGLKNYAQSLETRLAVREVAAVLTPTAFVRDFLVSRLGADPGKVKVAHFGPSQVSASPRRPAALQLNGGERFIFTAGSMEIYRGLEDLIEALPAIKTACPGLKLAVTGGARPATRRYFARLRGLAAANGTDRDIFWLGYGDREELDWCYSNCSAFVMTSRLESFGFPALEAMQHGCACVSSSSPCLPEIFGQAASYYEAGRPDGLAARVIEAIGNSADKRERLSRLAKERAAEFTWDRTAAVTLEALLNAAGPRSAADMSPN